MPDNSKPNRMGAKRLEIMGGFFNILHL
jgi:hypothetical protein